MEWLAKDSVRRSVFEADALVAYWGVAKPEFVAVVATEREERPGVAGAAAFALSSSHSFCSRKCQQRETLGIAVGENTYIRTIVVVVVVIVAAWRREIRLGLQVSTDTGEAPCGIGIFTLSLRKPVQTLDRVANTTSEFSSLSRSASLASDLDRSWVTLNCSLSERKRKKKQTPTRSRSSGGLHNIQDLLYGENLVNWRLA